MPACQIVINQISLHVEIELPPLRLHGFAN